MQSNIAFAYLDDMVLGGDVFVVAEDFLKLESEASKIGLKLNRNKCEVIGHNSDTRLIFESRGIAVQETNLANATLLGAPLIDSIALETMLAEKVQELHTLSERLQLLPAHDALYLLQHVGGRLVQSIGFHSRSFVLKFLFISV